MKIKPDNINFSIHIFVNIFKGRYINYSTLSYYQLLHLYYEIKIIRVVKSMIGRYFNRLFHYVFSQVFRYVELYFLLIAYYLYWLISLSNLSEAIQYQRVRYLEINYDYHIFSQ